MRKNFYFLILVLPFWFYLFTLNCFAQPISSTELINNAKQHDGQNVTYQGEVIGDLMRRGEFAWINVNDGQNAIGIWVKSSLVGEITYFGSHKSKGDIVEAAGVFHRACPEHGGDLDIHATALRKITPGSAQAEDIDTNKRNSAIIMVAAVGIIWILKLLKRR